MYSIEEIVTGVPKGSLSIRVGEIVNGEGGQWMPLVSEIAPGRYICSLAHVVPEQTPVGFPVPVWTDPDIAPAASEKLAKLMAEK